MENEKVTCPVCGIEFESKEEHETHHKEAHPNEPMSDENESAGDGALEDDAETAV